MIFVWIAVIALAIGLEVWTRRMLALWLAPAGVCALILQIAQVAPLYQVLACIGITALGILLSELFLIKRKSGGVVSDAVIGRTCTVTECVDDAACGQVCIDGQYWAARGVFDEDVFEKGESATVVAVEGVKLILKK